MALELMYITNNTEVALIAEKYGTDRIWIDLETLGKEERQAGMNTVKSKHTLQDISKIKQILTKAKLQVRVNPLNINSQNEIEEVISRGADVVMLPMFRKPKEVKKFIRYVDKKAKVLLLLETKTAVDNIDEILQIQGIDEIHIGLNDLHIEYRQKFMFELLADGTVEMLCEKIKRKNISVGFGGIASLNKGELSAREIIAEHYRLGSDRVILSRSFCNCECKQLKEIEDIFEKGIRELREYEDWLHSATPEFFKENKKKVKESVKKILNNMQ